MDTKTGQEIKRYAPAVGGVGANNAIDMLRPCLCYHGLQDIAVGIYA